MNNIVILPILIPLLTGIILIFFSQNIKAQRWISAISIFGTVFASLILAQKVFVEGILTLELGNWRPPFGIVLVADMFAILLVLTAAVVSMACLFFSFRSIGAEREKHYYYSFFQFLITGVFGAFLTGDLFNLFVFFEVLLMASYSLIVLGGKKIQFQESVKYILVNIISSALFVIGVGYLYSITGTLNMADLSQRISEIGQTGTLTVIAILFLIVFGLKGAIFPLFFWLPGSYKAPPTVITALFGALLTKVGLYAIIRVFTLIFYHEPQITHQLISVLGGLTIIVGVIGAVAYWDVKKIIIYNIMTAVGVIIYALSVLSPTSLSGAVFYLIHDMLIKAALFLLVGAMIVITGTSNLKEMGGLIKHHAFLGWMFFIAAISLVGVPPFSGFIGKYQIIRGGLESGSYLVAFIVLFSSLLVMYSVMKIFLNGFWREAKLSKAEEKGSTKGLLYPSAFLLIVSILFGVGAEWVYPYIDQAILTLTDPTIYIESVLKE